MADESKKDPYLKIIKEKGPPDFRIPTGLTGELTANSESEVALLKLEDQPGFDRLDSFQIFVAKLALVPLQLADSLGYIDFARVKRIADFGAGNGGSTFALATIARALGATVTAIEEEGVMADKIVQAGILPAESVIKADGLEYLNSLSTKGIQDYDLVTAFMLGPDRDGTLFRNLAQACSTALNPNGNLLVTSDTVTIEVVRKVAQASGVSFNRVQGFSEGKDIVPTTIIVPQSSCKAIGSPTNRSI